MKVNKYFFVILFLLSSVCNHTVAQNTEPEPLDRFLLYLEEQFHVVFTYADVNVEGIFVKVPKNNPDLDELLRKLEKQTDLQFKKINSRYIAVQKRIPELIISGTILDKSTGEKITGAVIYSGRTYVVSDEDGFFSIELNQQKDTVLVIRHVGYKTLHLGQKDWNSERSKYELETDIKILEEVKLNYISRGIDKLSDGSIQLNVQNIEVLPGLSEPDVLQIVQVLPGIQSINETVSDINTRGGTNDQTLVLWDGVKMYQTGHFFGLISAFNSHLIHKTKIIKNGTSAVYDEGISGTIDLHQQDYPVNDFVISAGLNMISADITLKIPVSQKLSFILGARHSINQIVKTPTYNSYYKRAFEHTELMLTRSGPDTIVDKYQDFNFYDVSGKLIYDISEKDKIRLSVLNVENNIEYEENATIRDTLYTRKSHLRQSNLLSNLNYTRSWSDQHATQLSAYVSHYQLDGSNVSIADNQYHLQENEVIDWGLKLETKNKIRETVEISSGYQFKEVGIRNQDNILKPDYSRDVKDVLRIHSLHAEAEFGELFRKLYLRTGLRTHYYSKFSSFSLEPRLALNYKLSKHFSLEALAEIKSQHTTQQIDFQTDFLGVEKRRWVLSNNESVPILKSQQVSLGIQYDRNNFLISLEGYAKEVSGIITPSQGFQNQYEYIYSTGSYNSRGMELLLNKRFRESNTWITYTLAKNDYYFEEFTPSSFPNNLDIRHSLSLGGNYTLKNFEVSGGFNYRTGKPYTKPARDNVNERNEIVYEAPNSSRLKDYIRLDISSNYSFNIKNAKGELGISIWNILNRKNIYNIFYQVNQNNQIEQIMQNTLGFTPNLSFRVRF